MRPHSVVQIGFGSLGREIFKELHSRKELKVVGVIDNHPNLLHKDAGMLTLNKKTRIRITDSLSSIRAKPDVALHATVSNLADAYDQIAEVLRHRINVLSTCEQLVYPNGRNVGLANKLDRIAKRYKVKVLGVGVNPGFVMDSLVIMLTSLCTRIDGIRVERWVDISARRSSLQHKMCMGLTEGEFETMKGKVGHMGLVESARMIFDALRLQEPRISINTRPVIAKRLIRSGGITVNPGKVAGIKHRLVARRRSSKFLELVLYMFAGADEFDLIEIEGEPPVYVRTNGVSGDRATTALLLNYVPILLNSEPGLHTVNALRLPSATIT